MRFFPKSLGSPFVIINWAIDGLAGLDVSLKAVEALRQAGYTVVGMVASFTYGFAVAEQAFEAANVRLITLSDYENAIAKAQETGYITIDDIKTLQEWRENPGKWNA